MWKTFYNQAFPDKRSLITDVLFNKGYRRWDVTVYTQTDTYRAVTWARDGDRLRRWLEAKEGVRGVEVLDLPLAGVNIWQQDGKIGGDVIITDDLLEAWEEATNGGK